MHRERREFHSFIGKHLHYAVVGASQNKEKYGNIVFHDLLAAGFTVYPVNPRAQTIDGQRCYPSLAALSPPVDVAVVVVPPSVGLTILDQAKDAHVQRLWFQPGAESDAIRAKAAVYGFEVSADGACIMVIRRQLGVV